MAVKRPLAAACLLLILTPFAWAHKVSIYAFTDGNAIQVEGFFNRNDKVHHGKITATDRETGTTVYSGTTNDAGIIRFRPDAEFLKTAHGLTITLNAGDGHQAEWIFSPEDLRGLAPTIRQPASFPLQKKKNLIAGHPVQSVSNGNDSNIINDCGNRQLATLIGDTIDSRLSPIRQQIARLEDPSPTIRDVIGGLGWIMGLLGIALYFKKKP